MRVERFGREGAPVFVIEDLLTDPGPLQRGAAAARFGEPAVKAYPGVRAPMPAAYATVLCDALLPLIRETFAMPGWRLAGAVSDYSLVTRRPEDLALRQRIPHTDGADPDQIALLHYLTPGGCGGTSFYRHRSTGFETVTPERRGQYEAALARDLGHHAPAGYIDGDTPVFERIGGVEGRFNRLIAYRGTLLHSGDVAGCGFSDDPARGRLTANTFFVMRPNEGQAGGITPA